MSTEDNYSHFDPWDDPDYRQVIIGYECLGCGHVQDMDDWDGQCDWCCGCSLSAIYE